MSIGHPIPQLWLFQNLTLKIKGQGHRWGHSSKSLCGCNILSTYIPFLPRQSGIPFLSYDFLKIWPWKSRVKAMGEVTLQRSQCGSNILSTHIPFVSCQSGIPFLSLGFYKIWPWKLRVKVMGEVTLQSQNGGLISYRLTFLSLHVNRPSHSWDTAFSKFDLENQGSRSKDHDVAQVQVQTIP